MSDDAARAVAARLGDRAVLDAPLGARTTYRVGGPAGVLFVAEDAGDLAAAAGAVAATGIEVAVVGRGSNLLVADTGFPGLVLILGEGLAGIDLSGRDGTVVAGGGADLPVLARRTAAAGWRGLE
ncbi:MAG TPA: FAD-binding protein, partial [Acidimicrobiales bacterium]|nr:FAD-binding protein [Acidimicrobiales bacterium]